MQLLCDGHRRVGHQRPRGLSRRLDSDLLYGWDGADSLYGEAGNDHIEGGNGNDSLYGGSGHDVCVAQYEVSCDD